ncbi:multicopper oxidase domain-containing protein [Methylocaldum sp.]|uniref:multicopper oxidase domain-containing protein n=1 Tax=Methylocaldum sp. TaxID=1969727 RepID=UPI002D6C92F4|nr:multicopper oxidase domain-containing protein [Methylocaldum sp.]HYE33831.1 multicopper oxidase domain-containing protein [Methylocaldum sp.]
MIQIRILLLHLAVLPLFSGIVSANTTRTYYIAAEETLWDYAPSYPINPMHGEKFNEDEKVFVEGNNSDRIGRQYYKAHYVEYTDASFTQVKERPPEWRHLGILGPVIRANVGDTIKVVLTNKTADMPVSLHPHGVLYLKDSEGTHYEDGTSGDDRKDDVVEPGETDTYIWKVPERSGPGPADPSSIVWLYHSHVNEVTDTNTGLVGPIIISRRGVLQSNGKLKGIDREFVVLFTVFDENKSFYLDKNISTFAPAAAEKSEDESFVESNLMHGMNGYVYHNVPGLTMKEGETVRWYQLALGTEVDLHTSHWHGNTLTEIGRRVDVVNLLPGTHVTVDMKPDNPGVWMYHCHVNDHIDAGMMASYTVTRRER